MQSKKSKLKRTIPESLPQLVVDFTRDLSNTFPEFSHLWQKWSSLDSLGVHGGVVQYGKNEITYLYDYFVNVYPERFFDILYQNEDIFAPGSQVPSLFLPDVDFRILMNCPNVSQTTKNAIWKYLQLILFSLTSSLNQLNFGEDTGSLFDGIDETELHNKIKDSIAEITEFFSKIKHDTASEPEPDEPKTTPSKPGNGQQDYIPDAQHIFDKLKTLLNGKIGTLAQKIMEEMSEDLKDWIDDLGLSAEDTSSTPTGIDFKKLMKHPQKLMAIIQKLTNKLKEKIQSGDINQTELMKEAGDFIQQFKEMGGANSEQFKEMFKNMSQQMGLGKHAKMDMNAIQRLEKKIKLNERMRSNLEKKRVVESTIETKGDGTSVFTVPGGEKQEKTSKEDIEKLIKQYGLEEKPQKNKKRKK